MNTNFKIILLLILTTFSCSKDDDNQQPLTITIPDSNFEQALIDLGYDTNGLTGDILKTEAEAITSLNLYNKSISDLRGIEGFINLEILNCQENNLVSLNLSSNSKLKELICTLNELTDLDVSNNLLLKELNCGANQLTSLNLSKNIELTQIMCAGNLLRSLDLRNGNNTNISVFSATNNPNLECIQVDNAIYSNSNWSNIDPQTGFSETCGEPISVPDSNFEQALITLGYDTNGLNGNISKTDAEIVTSLDVSNKNISNLQGIEGFINLTRLFCDTNDLENIDVTKNTLLTTLNCDKNQLTSLDVSNNEALERLKCDYNHLTSLDISNNEALDYLDCSQNDLTSLDLSENLVLEQLFVHYNQLINLDVSHNIELAKLNCFENQIVTLDFSNNTKLKYMACAVNLLTSLNIKNGNNTGIDFFQAKNNPNLTCVQVDDVEYSTTNWSDKIDNIESYSTDCY